VLEHTNQFLSKLNGVRETSNGWEARCPCRNDDDNPSLAVSEDESNGNILLTCHRGSPCSSKEICESMGLTQAALFAPSKRVTKEKLTLVKTYDYYDENGELLFQKLRYVDSSGKKTFRQRKPDGKGGWEYSLGDTPKILYRLPQVLKAIKDGYPVWVVEGEKDVETLLEMGIVATTMPGGAGKWLDIHTNALAGAVVEIVADRDEVGMAHAQVVLRELTKAGCQAQIWASPKYKDISDHLGAGMKIDELEYVDPVAGTEVPSKPEEVEEAEVIESPFTDAAQKLTDLLARTDLTPQQLVVKAHSIAGSVGQNAPVDFGRLVVWDEFVEEEFDDSYDWIIEGLLERGERVIVVAAEGVGKTMLARQMAILCACGIHPFTYQRMKPIRTLTIDLENPERIIKRTSTDIMKRAKARSGMKHVDAQLLIKPAGLDLMKSSDRTILEQAIETAKPELLVMGPLYKAFVDPGGRTSESVAIEVAKYLDYVRDTYKCALWLEHHAPLGESMSNRQLRPFGSAVWSRWPEFGISLTPDIGGGMPFLYDVKHFRGARDERQWPTKIKRGTLFPFEVVEFAKVTT
jgi:hypothetical protein